MRVCSQVPVDGLGFLLCGYLAVKGTDLLLDLVPQSPAGRRALGLSHLGCFDGSLFHLALRRSGSRKVRARSLQLLALLRDVLLDAPYLRTAAALEILGLFGDCGAALGDLVLHNICGVLRLLWILRYVDGSERGLGFSARLVRGLVNLVDQRDRTLVPCELSQMLFSESNFILAELMAGWQDQRGQNVFLLCLGVEEVV